MDAALNLTPKTHTTGRRLVVVIPVFDDWDSLAVLLKRLSATAPQLAVQVAILVVDDGSTAPHCAGLGREELPGFASLRILHLRRNLGHQRALATGLVYAQQYMPCDAVMVMDGDGEDLPEHAPALLKEFQAFEGREVIFAARAKRLENPMFRVFYTLYRLLHAVLVGLPVRVGNFSVLSGEALERLVVSTELWNHYAAAVVKSRLPFRAIPLARGKRISGESTMSFPALVAHGLSALSVFGDIVGARLLAVSSAGLVVACAATLAAVLIRTTMKQAIPDWATFALGLAALLLAQCVAISFIMVFLILASRTHVTFLPIRDCPYFFGRVEEVFRDE
jgi:hypothetical protein